MATESLAMHIPLSAPSRMEILMLPLLVLWIITGQCVLTRCEIARPASPAGFVVRALLLSGFSFAHNVAVGVDAFLWADVACA